MAFVTCFWFLVPGLFLDGMMTFFAILLLVGFHPVYRRLLAERIAQDDRVLNQSVDTSVAGDSSENDGRNAY